MENYNEEEIEEQKHDFFEIKDSLNMNNNKFLFNMK